MSQVQNKIRKFTLEIDDSDLNEQYQQRRFKQINYISRIIVYAKLTYGMFIISQFFKGCVGWKRPFVYQLFAIVHWLMIMICERYPKFQRYHASICVFTYCSFVSN